MDYQASSFSRKINLRKIFSQRALILALFALTSIYVQCKSVNAQYTQNPLTLDVTISATVLVGSWVHPDTPPTPSPGPINMTNTIDVAVFRGMSYPSSKISLLKNGFIVDEVYANSYGAFDIRVRNIAPGTYSFGIRAEDANQLKSKLLTFSLFISPGIATIIDNIFLPPTITSDKSEVKKGEMITFSGSSVPTTDMRLSFTALSEILKKSTSNASGTWSYTLDSSLLAFGDFEARARSMTASDTSVYSDPLLFKVGDKTVVRPKSSSLFGFRKKCDLNDDSRVNLLDFSIMAFWYKRLGFPAKVDLNTDSSINLTDLSILAYCWTG